MRFALPIAVSLVVTAVALAGNPPDPVESVVVPTGEAPCGIVAARDGGLWVGVYGAGKVLRINPTRGKVTTTVRIGRWACRVVVGPAAVWVTRDQAGEIVRISRGSGRLVRLKVGAGAFDLVLARGSVWATSFDIGTVARIDPVLSRVTRVFKVGGNPAGLALCGGRIWVGHGRSASWISTIDPATLRIGRIEVGTEAPGGRPASVETCGSRRRTPC